MRSRNRSIAAALLLAGGCASAQSGQRDVPPPLAAATQLVVVTTGDWDATRGELRRFVRAHADSAWRADGSAVPIVVGRTGLAWGVGFDAYATSASPDPEPRKREGDGRSPAGAFPLGQAFGFAPRDSLPALRVDYLQLAPAIECVDDTASAHYNAVVDRNAVRVDWSSSEKMRQVPQYQLGMIVEYNEPAVKGRGSCIFLPRRQVHCVENTGAGELRLLGVF